MLLDVDTLRELLVTAGLEPQEAVALRPDVPLDGQGVSSAVTAGLAAMLAERFGLPPAPQSLQGAGALDDWASFGKDRLDDEAVKRAAVARILAAERPLPEGSPYAIDMLRPEDAPGVARLFHIIYGDKYPVVDYYVPERLVALNRQRQVLTVVARLPTGEIAGQGAFYRSSPPNPGVYEQGQLLVDPQYRQTSMAFRILKRFDELSRSMDWAEGFFGEAVCTHLVTQKTAQKQGYPECGLELCLMPSGAYEKEGADGRVSCLVCLRVDRDRPGPLYLPECYREALEFVLSGYALDRDVHFAVSDSPQAAQTVLESRTFDFAQVARVQVAAIGQDFDRQLDAVDDMARRGNLAVVQVFLNTGAPGVAYAVNALRQRGYVLGGLFPLWFGPDGLMLQKLMVEPDFASINLHAERSKTILAYIRADWDQRNGRERHDNP